MFSAGVLNVPPVPSDVPLVATSYQLIVALATPLLAVSVVVCPAQRVRLAVGVVLVGPFGKAFT